MAEPKPCMDPAHMAAPVTIVNGDFEMCSVCGKERLSFKPDPEEDTLDALMTDQFEPHKPYILWMNNYTEGYAREDCDSIEECYRKAITHCASDFTITGPPIQVDFIERKSTEGTPS